MAGNAKEAVKNKIPDEAKGDFDTLKEDFGRLREDMQTLLKDAGALGRDGGHVVADRAKEHGKNIADQVRIGGSRVRETVEEHPLATIGCAIGVGLLAGMILRR